MFELVDEDDFNFENDDFLQEVFDTDRLYKQRKKDEKIPSAKSPMKVCTLDNVRSERKQNAANVASHEVLPQKSESAKSNCTNSPRAVEKPTSSVDCRSFGTKRTLPCTSNEYLEVANENMKSHVTSPWPNLKNQNEANPTLRHKKVKFRKSLNNVMNSISKWESKPWLNMMSELEFSNQLISQFNITWVKNKAALKELPAGKVPILIVLLSRVVEKASDMSSVIFMDRSGEIEGTIFFETTNDLYSNLEPGSVILLRQVALYSPPSQRHYLTITPANIVCIMQDNQRICPFSKSQLTAKVRLWLKDIEVSYGVNTSQIKQTKTPESTLNNTSKELDNSSTKTPTDTNDRRISASVDDEFNWNDDEFDQCLQHDFDKLLKDTETDEMLAKLDF